MVEQILEPGSRQFNTLAGVGNLEVPTIQKGDTANIVSTSTHKRGAGATVEGYLWFVQDNILDDDLAVRLTRSDNRLVRLALAKNIYLDPPVYELLASDMDAEVLAALETNPSYLRKY